MERVRAVRGVTDLPLQVDVNEFWSLDEATRLAADNRLLTTFLPVGDGVALSIKV